jgi:hypothetical protein
MVAELQGTDDDCLCENWLVGEIRRRRRGTGRFSRNKGLEWSKIHHESPPIAEERVILGRSLVGSVNHEGHCS